MYNLNQTNATVCVVEKEESRDVGEYAKYSWKYNIPVGTKYFGLKCPVVSFQVYIDIKFWGPNLLQQLWKIPQIFKGKQIRKN